MIKYLNRKWFNNKINKVKKLTLSFMTIATISFTGCLGGSNSNNNKKYDKYSDSSSSVVVNDYNNDEYKIFENDLIDNYDNSVDTNSINKSPNNISSEELKQKVTFSDIDTSIYKKAIKNTYADYYFQSIFNSESALSKYYSMQEYDSKHDLVYINSDKTINKDLLKSKIISNTNSFLSQTKRNYKELDSAIFNNAFDYIVEELEINLKEDIDIYQLDDNLNELKLVSGSLDGNGLFDNEEVVIVLNLRVIERNSNDNFLEMIVKHETNHVIQSASKKEKEKEGYSKNIGLVYEWDDLKFNTLGFQWFAEAGAENLMRYYVTAKFDENTYKYIVDSMNIMTYTGLSNNFNILTLPKISLQGNLDKLFDAFNCENESDKVELINMLYSFEIINNNRNTDFQNAYKDSQNEKFDSYAYIDIINTKCCETLSKYYYYNMIKALEKNTESLENIFSNIAIFESYLNSFTKIRYNQKDFQKTFIENYCKNQDAFFELLSINLNISIDDLYSSYNEFCKKNNTITFNSDYMNSDNIYFINCIFNQKKVNKLPNSIRSMSKNEVKLLK